ELQRADGLVVSAHGGGPSGVPVGLLRRASDLVADLSLELGQVRLALGPGLGRGLAELDDLGALGELGQEQAAGGQLLGLLALAELESGLAVVQGLGEVGLGLVQLGLGLVQLGLQLVGLLGLGLELADLFGSEGHVGVLAERRGGLLGLGLDVPRVLREVLDGVLGDHLVGLLLAVG